MTSNNVYQIVTDKILHELEQGIVPWHKPWTCARSGRVSSTTAAVSHTTGRPYSLLNQCLLGRPGEWVTWKQAHDEGGTIRKGERASVVVFWKQMTVKEIGPCTGEETLRSVPILRYFNVFHIDQCEGLTPKWVNVEKPTGSAPAPIEIAEDLSASYLTRTGVTLRHVAGDRAFYRPGTDSITLPLREQFSDANEYYATLFHEEAHSTGHPSRLNRLHTAAAFGSDDYGKEELVAEISSACVLHRCGVETAGTLRNSAAYVANWIKAIRGDNRLVVSAAGRAEKAVALITGEAV